MSKTKKVAHLNASRKFVVSSKPDSKPPVVLPKDWLVHSVDLHLRGLIDSIRINTAYCQLGMAALRQWFLAALSGARVTGLIIGVSGTGKTKLLEMFAALFPPYRDENGLKHRVVIVNVPSEPTPISLLEAMLLALGDPRPASGTRSAKTRRVINAIVAQGVLMLILDDLQRFVDRNSDLVLYSASECLKEILSNTGISIVCAGLPEARLVVDANEQLKRHFTSPVNIPRFNWSDEESRTAFVALLRAFQKRLSMFEIPKLTGSEMALRVYLGTGGLIDFIAKILKQIVWDAMDRGSRKVTLKDMETAWSRALWDAEKLGENPFSENFEVRKDTEQKIEAAKKINQRVERPIGKRHRKSALKLIGL